MPAHVFISIIVPMRAGFDQIDSDSPKFWFAFDIVSDLYFYFDMFLNFRTAFFDGENVLHSKTGHVAWNYMKGWFIVDLSSCLPLSYILYINDPTALPWRAAESGCEASTSAGSLKMLKILRLLRLGKMLRMLKLKELLEKYEDNKVAPTLS